MREDIKLLKEEVKSLKTKLLDARNQTGRMGIRMLEAQESLEEAKRLLAKCNCDATLKE